LGSTSEANPQIGGISYTEDESSPGGLLELPTPFVQIGPVEYEESEIDPLFGGGILNLGTLVLTNVSVTNSVSHYGAGIMNNDSLEVSNSLIDGNTAIQSGGGLWTVGTANISQSTLSNNHVLSETYASGILAHGALTVTNSTIAGVRDSVFSVGLRLYNTTFLNNCTITGHNLGLVTFEGDELLGFEHFRFRIWDLFRTSCFEIWSCGGPGSRKVIKGPPRIRFRSRASSANAPAKTVPDR